MQQRHFDYLIVQSVSFEKLKSSFTLFAFRIFLFCLLSGFFLSHKCKGCGATFVEKSCFNIHLKQSSSCLKANPQLFKCFKCHDTFYELHHLQQHIRRHELMKIRQPGSKQCYTALPKNRQGLKSAKQYHQSQDTGNSLEFYFGRYCAKVSMYIYT